MTKSDSNKLSKCRLLTLLLVLVVVGTSSNQVNGASLGLHTANWENIFNNSVTKDPFTEIPGSTQVRLHFLLNHCSNKFVKVIRLGRKGVNARGKYRPKMSFSTVVFKSTPRGTIVMRGKESNNYICIGRTGRPAARAKLRATGCEFKEEYVGHSMRYRLANDSREIYLGFNKDGRPLKGTNNKKNKHDCFKFTKLPINPEGGTVKCPSTNGKGPQGVDFCDIYKLTYNKRKQTKARARKLRHNKHHKQSRHSER